MQNERSRVKSLPCIKYVLFTVGGFLILYVYLYYNVATVTYLSNSAQKYRDFLIRPVNKSSVQGNGEVDSNSNPNLIDTPGCTLPKTDLIPPKYGRIKASKHPICTFEKRIVSIDDQTHMLKILPVSIGKKSAGDKNKTKSVICSVVHIIRNTKRDTFAYGEEHYVTKSLNISDKELVATKCGPYINFDAHFPITPSVKEKMQHWREEKELKREEPISILLMGFDTTSRSHIHRSFKRALPLMLDQLGFVDFKGYHSIDTSTTSNFFAFLLGLETEEVRDTCAGSLPIPYDHCPLVWKHFDKNKFVTMFIEDGEQSFKWGSQSGFENTPTDYYPHPLFSSVGPYRKKFNSKQSSGCMSTLNPQNFILDYTKRFLSKFVHTPFFAFIWFAYPFHESTSALPGFDDNFTQFMEFLNSNESSELRERTLIILNTDHGHGHRLGSFVRETKEGFIERSLAGLFIRLPDKLQGRFPRLKLREALEINSKRLTSGFDIHNTLLHLLHLQGLPFFDGTKPFQLTLQDRSTLFIPISDKRSCKDIHVAKETCICNMSAVNVNTTTAIHNHNANFTHQLLVFALKELNSLILNSRYKDQCLPHGMPKQNASLLSANVLLESNDFTEVNLKFLTDLQAPFQVMLRAFMFNNTDEAKTMRMTRIGDFHRTNLYQNLSWCVGFKTDEDRLMKEICHCRVKNLIKS